MKTFDPRRQTWLEYLKIVKGKAKNSYTEGPDELNMFLIVWNTLSDGQDIILCDFLFQELLCINEMWIYSFCHFLLTAFGAKHSPSET